MGLEMFGGERMHYPKRECILLPGDVEDRNKCNDMSR